MKLAKNISFFIVISIIISLIGKGLESKFLFTYLQQNIIGLLLTLLAINTATLGLIASKIQKWNLFRDSLLSALSNGIYLNVVILKFCETASNSGCFLARSNNISESAISSLINFLACFSSFA